MSNLRQELYNSSCEVFHTFLSSLGTKDITENGALQLLFDYMFLNTIFQDVQKSALDNAIIEKLQTQVKIYKVFI
jgi:hypothetical protein